MSKYTPFLNNLPLTIGLTLTKAEALKVLRRAKKCQRGSGARWETGDFLQYYDKEGNKHQLNLS